MNEHEFELRLRAAYRSEVAAAESPPDALWNSVFAIPDESPHVGSVEPRRRILFLAAVAMLLTLAIGSAVAIGSGLIRLPWLPDGVLSQHSVLGAFDCGMTLREGVLLSTEVSPEPGGGPPSLIVLLENGQLLRGTSSNIGGESWQRRRLTADGVSRLLASVAASGLPDCSDVGTGSGRVFTVWARLGAEVLHMRIAGGDGEPGWLGHVAAQAEIDAARTLALRLADSDLDVPTSEWLDQEWQPLTQNPGEILAGGGLVADDSSQRGYLIANLDECGYLPASLSLGGPPNEGGGYGRGWAECQYGALGVQVFASLHPVAMEDALAIVGNQFGPSFTVEEMAGRAVYINDCVGTDLACTPAVAVSAEPHFVVIVPGWDASYDALRHFASEVIDSLD